MGDGVARRAAVNGYTRRLSRVAGPYSILRVAGQVAEFIGFLVLARRLEPTSFGILSIAFLVCRYAGVIGDWGALTRGSRDVAAEGLHGSIHSYVRHRNLVSSGMALLVAIGMVASGHQSLLPMVVVVLTLGLSRDWIALGRETGVRAALPGFVQGAVLVAASLFVTTLDGAAVAIALAYGGALILSIARNRLPADDGSGSGAPAVWILLAFIGTQVMSTVDTILLGILQSATDAGIYAAVYRLPNAWLAILTALVGGAMPIATRAVLADPTGHRRLRNRSLRISGLFGALVLLTTPIVYVAVPILFGPDYAPGQTPAAILMVATALITLSLPLHIFAVASGHDRRYAAIVLTGATVNIAVNAAVIPRWGMTGAACATVASQVLVTALLWVVGERRLVPIPDGALPATGSATEGGG